MPALQVASSTVKDELQSGGGWLTDDQTPVYNLGLSLLTGSSRLPGSSVVWIAPEFSSGRQVSQSKH